VFASVGGRCGPFWSISERKERTWQRCAFRTNLIQPCLIDPPTAPYQVLLCLLYASRCGRGWRLQWSRPCSQHRHCSGTPERPKAHPLTIGGLVHQQQSSPLRCLSMSQAAQATSWLLHRPVWFRRHVRHCTEAVRLAFKRDIGLIWLLVFSPSMWFAWLD
jgi:hypothetical protein